MKFLVVTNISQEMGNFSQQQNTEETLNYIYRSVEAPFLFIIRISVHLLQTSQHKIRKYLQSNIVFKNMPKLSFVFLKKYLPHLKGCLILSFVRICSFVMVQKYPKSGKIKKTSPPPHTHTHTFYVNR